MKRIFALFFCIIFTLSLFGCKGKKENDINENSSSLAGEAMSSGVDNVSSKTPSETEAASSLLQSAEVGSSPTVSTEQVSSVAPLPNVTLPTREPLQVFTFTVNDPDNSLGLNTERRGFSYGVAKNGVPHSQSIANQATFDSFPNVKALALDTKTREKVMYLTFDNGYEYQNLTASILDTLKEKQVKAAFFVTLDYAKKNPYLVERMINEGHIVGNHSTTHPSFPKLTRPQMAEEIGTLDNYLRANFGYSSPYFRFPEGAYSECALELVTSIGFHSVFWSVAYADWDTSTQKGPDYAHTTVTSRFHPGAVILLHAVSKDNANALGRIIDTAVAEGYSFASLDDYFN